MAFVDQFNLSQDSTFQGRVRIAAVAAAQAIHNEVFTALTTRRDAFGKQVLENNPSGVYQLIALAVATDPTVASEAGAPFNQSAVSDGAISNAVSAAWNSFAISD